MRLLAGNVVHLALRGDYDPSVAFDWSSADYLHNSPNLRHLVILLLHIKVGFDDKKAPIGVCSAKIVTLVNVKFSGAVEFSQILPSAE